MNILIVEDEIKSAKSLASLVADLRPAAKVVAQLQSISSTVKHLSTQAEPDLIFMDIQLSDGNCFEIFKAVRVRCPIIFCTAFDEYMLEAFRANAIDYVLKPFSRDTIAAALEKVDMLKNFFQQPVQPNIEDILAKITAPPPAGKNSFLVFKDNKYTTVPTENIAYFFVKYESSFIITFDKQEYPVNQSLDHIHQSLTEKQFYRLNRQYLINFTAVKEVEHYFARKLLVKLSVPAPEKLLVAKEKVTAFLEWLENR
jgi:two-component system response regulator LytT